MSSPCHVELILNEEEAKVEKASTTSVAKLSKKRLVQLRKN
jgi:hypothetical protein